MHSIARDQVYTCFLSFSISSSSPSFLLLQSYLSVAPGHRALRRRPPTSSSLSFLSVPSRHRLLPSNRCICRILHGWLPNNPCFMSSVSCSESTPARWWCLFLFSFCMVACISACMLHAYLPSIVILATIRLLFRCPHRASASLLLHRTFYASLPHRATL